MCNKPKKKCGCNGCTPCIHDECTIISYTEVVHSKSISNFNIRNEQALVQKAIQKAVTFHLKPLLQCCYDLMCQAIKEEDCLSDCWASLRKKTLHFVIFWAEYYYMYDNKTILFDAKVPKLVTDFAMFDLVLKQKRQQAHTAKTYVEEFLRCNPSCYPCWIDPKHPKKCDPLIQEDNNYQQHYHNKNDHDEDDTWFIM